MTLQILFYKYVYPLHKLYRGHVLIIQKKLYRQRTIERPEKDEKKGRSLG